MVSQLTYEKGQGRSDQGSVGLKTMSDRPSTSCHLDICPHVRCNCGILKWLMASYLVSDKNHLFSCIVLSLLFLISPLSTSIIIKTIIHKCRSIFRILGYVRLCEKIECGLVRLDPVPYEVAYEKVKSHDHFIIYNPYINFSHVNLCIKTI